MSTTCYARVLRLQSRQCLPRLQTDSNASSLSTYFEVGQDSSLDHLGMYFAEDSQGTYLSMHNYIDTMVVRLGMEGDDCSKARLPMHKPIDDYEPLSPSEAKWFMSACGMIGWLSGTGRPDLRYAHSRISQHMAAPCKGALSAVKTAVKYCKNTRDWCLWQPKGQPAPWSHFSDSDHAGNAERQNYRRSQLGYVSMRGHAPIGWGSKASSVMFGPSQLVSADDSLPSRGKNLVTPVCHPKVPDLHPDVSSGAAEIYAASVALSEVLHLSYVCDEMGDPMSMPLALQVDNAAGSSVYLYCHHRLWATHARFPNCTGLVTSISLQSV